MYSFSVKRKEIHTSLDRETFEQLVEDLVERTRKPCEEALKMAGMTPDMVNEILLVGGQTRTPRVAAVVQEIFGQEPDNRINPDEVVGVGAAIQAGIIKGDVKDLVLLDVTPLSLGIETRGGMFTKIIERNATIPTRKSRTFTTVTDNQTKVKVHVLQGEREIAAHNKALGEFELVGIPPAPKGVPQVEVTFDIDSNGIVNVHARDMATNREQKIIVTPSGGLNEDEIITIIEDAKVHADEDRRKAEYIRTRSRLEGMVDSNQKTFNEFGAMLSPENQEIVRTILENSKKAVESGSNDRCYEALEKLAEVGVILSEVILYDPGAISADPDEPASDEAGSAEEA